MPARNSPRKGAKKSKLESITPSSFLDADDDAKNKSSLVKDLLSPVDAPKSKKAFQWGQVRASPYGSCLESVHDGKKTSDWDEWRKDHLQPLQVPREGFGHVYGQDVIDRVDGTDLGDATDENHTPATGEGELKNAHDFGSTKTPDDAPVSSLVDKWRLLPHFLKLRSLMRQHVDSFDHLINVELNKIVQSPSAREIRSEHDPNFYLRYV